jgi:hypothetical protein
MLKGNFRVQVSPGPLNFPLGPLRFFSKIRGDIRNFVFIASVVDAGHKLFTGVNDTDNKLSPVSYYHEKT